MPVLFSDRVLRLAYIIPHTTVSTHRHIYDVTLLQQVFPNMSAVTVNRMT